MFDVLVCFVFIFICADIIGIWNSTLPTFTTVFYLQNFTLMDSFSSQLLDEMVYYVGCDSIIVGFWRGFSFLWEGNCWKEWKCWKNSKTVLMFSKDVFIFVMFIMEAITFWWEYLFDSFSSLQFSVNKILVTIL